MKHLLFIAILLSSFAANAANFSFTGNLNHDDDFRTFNFTVASTSNVTIRTWSNAGGTNSDGVLIPSGGFDPLLVLFDSSGTWITSNDDIDGFNGMYDSLLNWDLDAGNYIVALAQFGTDLTQSPNLAEIVWSTYYEDFDGLTSFYALDINNVSSASALNNNVSSVPVPAAVWLFGSAFMGLLGMRKKSHLATA
jgi:hypothetical protein